MALMAKWWWSIVTSPQGSIQRLLLSEYGSRLGTWHARLRNLSSTSGFWRGVVLSKSIFWLSVAYKLGKSGNIFWYNS